MELRRLQSRMSLTAKMIILAVVAGLAAWLVMDFFTARSTGTLFQHYLFQTLDRQSQEDRLRFDTYLNDFRQAAVLMATQDQFVFHLWEMPWFVPPHPAEEVIIHTTPPDWFPNRSLLRSLASPRIVIIFDQENHPLEIYHHRLDTPPEDLLRPSPLLLERSLNQTYLATLDNRPFMITARKINNDYGGTFLLLCASPIDDRLLLIIQADFPSHFVGLLSPQGTTILVSSDNAKLPAGTPVSSITTDYLVTKQEYHLYGSAETPFNFVSFVPRQMVEALTLSFVNNNRRQNAFMAACLIAVSALLMSWFARRVSRVSRHIEEYSRQKLGSSQNLPASGDQLSILEEKFHQLTSEVERRTDQLAATNNELREAYTFLKGAQEELVQAEKLAVVGQMAGIVAHEVLNPVSAIALRVEKNISQSDRCLLVLAKLATITAGLTPAPGAADQDLASLRQIGTALTKNQEDRHEDLLFLNQQISRVIKIVDGFRQMARTRRNIERIDLVQLLQGIIDDMKDSLEKRHIEISATLPATPHLDADHMELYSVFSNLLRNAMQAVENNPLEKGRHIGLELCHLSPEKLDVLVRDNGGGIATDLWETIFEPSFTSKGRKGTGLGLSMSRKIMRSYHGDIKVLVSTPNQGTTFLTTLPLNQPQEATASPPILTKPETNSHG